MSTALTEIKLNMCFNSIKPRNSRRYELERWNLAWNIRSVRTRQLRTRLCLGKNLVDFSPVTRFEKFFLLNK